MKKLIRPTYPLEFSIGLLTLIFFIALLLSLQVFDTPFHSLNNRPDVYFGMFLVSLAVVIMTIIMWEEFLFPVKAKEIPFGLVFRNKRKKLKSQALIYCAIPAIFIYVFFEYEINVFRFVLWAAVCIIPPIVEKFISGINNYNDFLVLTDHKIEYKNNAKEGDFDVNKIVQICIVKDAQGFLKNLQLLFKNTTTVTIALDEMELSAFYDAIYSFIVSHYKDFYTETAETE